METATRLIENTTQPMAFDWPADCKVQGGSRGVVLTDNGDYVTAFVEAFPRDPNTFLRGEGDTIADAEAHCWLQYEVMRSCDHGTYERREYRNGAGYCTKCGTWFPGVFEPLPEDPNRIPSRLEQALTPGPGAVRGLADMLDALAADAARRDAADGNAQA